MVSFRTVEPSPNTDGGQFFLGQGESQQANRSRSGKEPRLRLVPSDPETEGRLVDGEDAVSDVGSRHQRPASRNEVHDQ
jgi:hypothetical protein